MNTITKNYIGTENYQIFNIDNRDFVFLTGVHDVMEIVNPELKKYFSVHTNKIKTEVAEQLTQTITTLREQKCKPALERKLEAPKQMMITLNTTHGCNMACKYCFASTQKDKMSVMPLSVAQKAIEGIVKENPQVEKFSIYFFGGEPLLHKPFIKAVVPMARDIMKKYNHTVNFMLNTNATLLDDPDLLKFMHIEDFVVTVSIDGPKTINDENRIFHNGHGTFDRIIKGMQLLRDYQVKFNLRATFSPQNRNLVEVFDFFEQQKATFAYAFTVPSSTKEAEKTQFTDNDLERLDKELARIEDYYLDKLLRQETIYQTDFRLKWAYLQNQHINVSGCEAGHGEFIIDEKGNYYPCQNLLPFAETRCGNIEDGIDKDKCHEFGVQRLSELDNCQNCWCRFLCGGGCATERYMNRGLKSISNRCKLTQLEWKHMISLFIKYHFAGEKNIE